ncbi:Cupin 1 - like 10 [Theobroma cacao]|nr:Cupin 1 - like 10 [Theobroma cacao]
MKGAYFILGFTLLILASSFASACDPIIVNGKFCKDPKLATVNDFFFSGLNIPKNTSNSVGSVVTPVNVDQIPGLNTLGISLVRIDYAPNGGLNPPHTHPRGTEILVVLEGTLYTKRMKQQSSKNIFDGKLLAVYQIKQEHSLISIHCNDPREQYSSMKNLACLAFNISDLRNASGLFGLVSDWFIKYRIDLEAEMQSFNLIPSYRNYNTFYLVVRSDDDKGDSVVAVLESVRGISLVNYVLSPTIIDLGFLAVALAALSSQNPGVITIAINAEFGSDPAINPDLLAKAFKLDRKMVKNLQSKF